MMVSLLSRLAPIVRPLAARGAPALAALILGVGLAMDAGAQPIPLDSPYPYDDGWFGWSISGVPDVDGDGYAHADTHTDLDANADADFNGDAHAYRDARLPATLRYQPRRCSGPA